MMIVVSQVDNKFMCNHTYTANYARLPKSMGNKCPYPDFYQKALSRVPSRPEKGAIPKLPVDKQGVCIFHSQEVAWKRENDFTGHFLKLLKLIEYDEFHDFYNFAEFKFVGNELRTKRGSEYHVLNISDITFRKQAYFTGACFLNNLEMKDVTFEGGASFGQTTFVRDVSVSNARFCGVEFGNAQFSQLALFSNVDFLSYALFDNAKFTGAASGYIVKFVDSRFEGLTDFSGAIFNPTGNDSSMGFINVKFEDFTDFKNAQFHNHIVFEDASFASRTEFIDTLFDTANSSARYRGAAVEFKRIALKSEADLVFKNTDPLKKMFNHDVQMSFMEDPEGIIWFENVNFSKFNLESRDRLTRLAKTGKVEIGSGCIKYRFQTEVRTIVISQSNASLILEICQTFTNYFTVSNGLNLGFEVVERNKTGISFFYFTDENISEAIFLERLAKTEQHVLSLLSISSVDQVMALEAPPGGTVPSTSTKTAIINTVDGISALLGTFFRVGARIALGSWEKDDTKALLGAIRFNDNSTDAPAQLLHQVLVDKYTDESLLLLNHQQNEKLKLEVTQGDTYIMGDTHYNIHGNNSSQIVIAPNSSDINVNQVKSDINKSMDLLQLAVELSMLRQSMSQEATEMEHHIAVGNVAKAEQAAKAKDSSGVAEHLKSAGKWALDVAKKIGVSLASEVLKDSMGLK